MESVVYEALRDVVHLYVGGHFKRTQIEDELVCTSAVLVCVQNRVVFLELLCHVVGVQYGEECGFGKRLGAHHGDVRERDREDER